MSRTATGKGAGATAAEAAVRAASAAGAALAQPPEDTCAKAHNRAHALLGPSSAERWIACPPSARLEERLQDKTGEDAAEGTSAHTLVELLIQTEIGGNDGADIADVEAFTKYDKFYCAEMQEYASEFVAYVMERLAAAQAKCPDAILLSEQRLDYSEWVPEGFGTGDILIVSDAWLEVIDFKYGKGVPVDAKNNPQLRLYGAGALAMFGDLYDFERIVVTIYQPRISKITTEEFNRTDLTAWLLLTVKPTATLAWEGRGAFCAGGHCQFCRAKAQCKTLAEYHMALAKYDFMDTALLSWEEIADILNRQKAFEAWLTAVHTFAEHEAIHHGQEIPGWKLVEGKSTRSIVDSDAAKKILVDAAYPEAIIMTTPELLGITALEKAVGKKKLTELLGGLIQKPPGKMTLAPEADKRHAIGSAASAAEDFSDNE